VSDRAPDALPPRSGPAIHPDFSRSPAGDARLGNIMMMSFARVQVGRSFLVSSIRKQTGCSLADGASTQDESQRSEEGPLLPPSSNYSSALNETHENHDHRHYQKDVNEAPHRIRRYQSQEPGDDQDKSQSIKHKSVLI
jgi:hypothetical protein